MDLLAARKGLCQSHVMRPRILNQLLAIARRECGPHLAEDVVQEALVIAVEAGRLDISSPETGRWLRGVVRNRARMQLRSDRRRRTREQAFGALPPADATETGASLNEVMQGLSPALRGFAALVMTGHSRREISWLLDLSDTALRQRVSALKRALRARGLVAPSELTGLSLGLDYGRIRDVLLPELHRQKGHFASHDPDGHLFVVRRSQIADRRQ